MYAFVMTSKQIKYVAFWKTNEDVSSYRHGISVIINYIFNVWLVGLLKPQKTTFLFKAQLIVHCYPSLVSNPVILSPLPLKKVL